MQRIIILSLLLILVGGATLPPTPKPIKCAPGAICTPPPVCSPVSCF